MPDPLDQNSQVFIAGGGFPLPVMRTRFGSSLSQAVTTTAGASTQITVGGCSRIVRIFAIGCPIYYKLGATGMTAPGAVDGYVPQDLYLDDILQAEPDNFVRFIAVTGTGTARLQVMG
jgi:hypothetical protein